MAFVVAPEALVPKPLKWWMKEMGRAEKWFHDRRKKDGFPLRKLGGDWYATPLEVWEFLNGDAEEGRKMAAQQEGAQDGGDGGGVRDDAGGGDSGRPGKGKIAKAGTGHPMHEYQRRNDIG